MSTVQERQDKLEPLLRASPVIAIVTIDDVTHAAPMAQALIDGGVMSIEVTLRTSAALGAIEAIRVKVPEACVGAGTVLTPDDVTSAENAGSQFFVSPGASPKLIDAMEKSEVPWLPGSSSASEAMSMFERGYRLQKFFPAEAAGGVDFLRGLAAPLPKIDLLLYRAPGSPTPAATALHDYLAHNLMHAPGSDSQDARVIAPQPPAQPALVVSAGAESRPAVQPRTGRFESRRDAKNAPFLEPRGDDLQTDRQTVSVEATRNRGRRQSRQIDRP